MRASMMADRRRYAESVCWMIEFTDFRDSDIHPHEHFFV